MVFSFLRSFYDKSYHKLSPEKIEEFKENIESNYKNFAEKYGEEYFDIEQFRKRYENAIEKKYDIFQFFKLEIENIDTFIQKIRKYEMEKKTNFSKIFSEEKIENGEEEKKDKETIQVDTATEKLYKEFEEKIKAYPKIFIHKDASEEIERILGAIIDLRNKSISALLYMKKWMLGETEMLDLYAETRVLFDDLSLEKGEDRIPFVFHNYKFKVENSGGDDHVIELADIYVLRKIVDVMKRFKRIINYLNLPKFSGMTEATIEYNDEKVNLTTFRSLFRKDITKILKDFRLENF